MAQLMPLPLTVFCFSKIQIGFTFLVPAYPGSPGQKAVKRVCVCVCSSGLNVSYIRQTAVGLDSVCSKVPVKNVCECLNDDVVLQLSLKSLASSAAQAPVPVVTSAPTEVAPQPPSTAQVDLLGLGSMLSYEHFAQS